MSCGDGAAAACQASPPHPALPPWRLRRRSPHGVSTRALAAAPASTLFPVEVRSSCNGAAAAAGKFGALVGTFFFEPLVDAYGELAMFVACAAVAALGALVTHVAFFRAGGGVLADRAPGGGGGSGTGKGGGKGGKGGGGGGALSENVEASVSLMTLDDDDELDADADDSYHPVGDAPRTSAAAWRLKHGGDGGGDGSAAGAAGGGAPAASSGGEYRDDYYDDDDDDDDAADASCCGVGGDALIVEEEEDARLLTV